MRLPVPAPIESRDGTVEKDGLCKNLLIEQDDEVLLSALRPGLTLTDGSIVGVGNGIVEFNGKLLSVFDATLSIIEESIPTGQGTQLFLSEFSATGFVVDISSDGNRIFGTYPKDGKDTPFVWDRFAGIKHDPGLAFQGKSMSPLFFSDDGETFIATSSNLSDVFRVVRWTSADGYSDLFATSRVFWANKECTTICGSIDSSGNGYVWTASGGLVDIGNGGYAFCYAMCASDDGSVVVGTLFNSIGINSSTAVPFRWTAGSGIVVLGTNKGNGMWCSEDGKISVGTYSPTDFVSNSDRSIFKWTAAEGFTGITLTDSWESASLTKWSGRCRGVNSDATTIAGYGLFLGLYPATFIWSQDNGFRSIGDLGGLSNSPIAHSANVDFIYGTGLDELDVERGYFYTSYYDLDMMSIGDQLPYSGMISDKGIIAANDYYGYAPFRWSLMPDRRRSLADLEDVQMDFAQSTI